MPPTLSKDSFNAASGYEKVILTVDGALLDFDTNELQDIARDARMRILAQMQEGATLLGSAGTVKVATSGLARMVDVVGGVVMSGGQVVRIPTQADVQVFANGTVSGTVSSAVYVAWSDSQVDYTTDATIRPTDPTNFGNGNWRLKRTVQIRVVQGSTTLPAPGAGETFIRLANITHDFTGNGTVIGATDIAQEPYGVTPGELAGYGPTRPIRVFSNASAAEDAHVFDTRLNHTAGILFRWRNFGSTKASMDYRGFLRVGDSTAPTEALDVFGNIKATGNISPTGNVIMAAAATVDGVDVGSHVHTGGANGPQLDHGAALTGLADDDHTQYVHNTTARTISAVHTFNPGSAGAPFVLGANATGQKVVGLNADLLDGLDSAYLLDVTNATGTLADARLTSNVPLKNAANVFTTQQQLSRAAVADAAWSAMVNGDTNSRFVVQAGGTLAWGPGNAAQDVTLYRSAADVLKTDDNLDALALRIGGTAVISAARALTNVTMDGGLVTSGTVVDARLSSNVPLKNVSNVFTAEQRMTNAVAANAVIGSAVTGDTVDRFKVAASGAMEWGPGGSTARDTTLARDAAASLLLTGALRTTGRFKADSNLLDAGVGTLSITTTGSIQVDSVGKRALITYFKIDPGAYAGTYDVNVYQDNNTSSTLLARWQGQSGIMEDRAPFFFKNVRSDERMYVQITKATGGTPHTFTATIDAERFA